RNQDEQTRWPTPTRAKANTNGAKSWAIGLTERDGSSVHVLRAGSGPMKPRSQRADRHNARRLASAYQRAPHRLRHRLSAFGATPFMRFAVLRPRCPPVLVRLIRPPRWAARPGPAISDRFCGDRPLTR